MWFAEMQRRYEEKCDISGLLTPWKALNELTSGLQPGDLILIAGRPSMGKSILGEQLSTFNALRGNRTDVYSLEMRAQQWIQRGVCSLSGTAHRHMQRPSLITDPEWATIMGAMERISAAPLYIDDQPQLTAQQIIARAERQHMRQPSTLIVVDHLHEIKRPGRDPVNELADAAGALRALGKKLHVPVVLLAQLNRAAANRTDHRPTMSDLRASGAVEEKADIILLLHREDYYDRSTHLKGVVEVIVEKGRDLPRGETIHLQNRFDIMRADDWEGPLPTPKSEDDKPKRKTLRQAANEYQGARE
jgi:replicative DNA helicase